MHNRQNLPLSPLKVIKKTLAKNSKTIFGIIFGLLIYGTMFYAPIIFSPYGTLNDQESKEIFSIFWIIVLVMVGFGLLKVLVILIYEYLYYRTYDYEFGETAASVTKGVITRDSGHITYDRLQNIYVDQDFLDRIFGLYDVHYETAGETSASYLHVDGLNKPNTDILVAFLKSKSLK